MKANKVTVTIEVECLDIQSVGERVLKCLEQIDTENLNGKLVASDGDSVTWKTDVKEVTF